MKTPSSQAEHDFIKRHIGSNERELSAILKALQASSLEDLTEQIIPEEIYKKASFHFPPPPLGNGNVGKSQTNGRQKSDFQILHRPGL